MFTSSRFATRLRRVIGFASYALVAATCNVRPASANAELVSEPAAVRLGNAFRDITWQDHLTASDKEKVMQGLNSKLGPIVERAVEIVALHRFIEAVPLLEKAGFKSEEGRTIAEMIIKSFRSGQDPVASMRDLLVEDRVEESWAVANSEGMNVKEWMIEIVAIDEARRIRKGGRPNLKLAQTKLDSYGDILLRYSKMKPEAAIDDIFERLRNITNESNEQDDLLRVLETYREKAFNHLLEKFADVRDLNTMTGYGIGKLLVHVGRYGMQHDLSAEQAAQANELIARLEAQGSPYVVQTLFGLKKSIELIAQRNNALKASQAATAAP